MHKSLNTRTEPSEPATISSPDVRKGPVWALATGAGFGCAKILPGSMGTLWGLPICWALFRLQANIFAWAAAIALLLALGWLVCGKYIQATGRHDPSEVVIDEYAAFPIVMLGVPFSWWSLLLGFLLFRAFDIGKPWPISRLEQIPGASGVMADDIGAAIVAGGLLYFIDLAYPLT